MIGSEFSVPVSEVLITRILLLFQHDAQIGLIQRLGVTALDAYGWEIPLG